MRGAFPPSRTPPRRALRDTQAVRAFAGSRRGRSLPRALSVLERGEATQSTIEACKRLREKGYRIALDDFVPEEENFPPL